MDFDNTDSPGRFFTSLVKELKSLAISNIEYFKTGTQSHHAKFHVAFCMLFEYLDLGIEPCFREIAQRVHEFDVSPTEKGNGYRSLLRIVQKCCLHLLQLSRYISANKDSMLFRRYFYMKELEAYVATLGQLRACLYYAQKLMTYCQAGCLFADEETLDDAVAEQLMTDVEMLSQDCFYGRCLGFQFCESMQRPLQVVAIAMASFAEGYQENSQIMKVATSLFNSGKYLMNPDLRAQQVVNVTRTADIQFCKAFWSITDSDIMHQLPSMVCPSVQVDEVFHLGPDAFDMPSGDGNEEVTITPPCAHTGPAPVQVRLISYQLREGQEQHMKSTKLSPSSRNSPQRAPRSHGLIVHCHGGGFVAQSSRSHEVYLRHWAKDLDVPILSIDYSLAPESPFPRALEECFYAYAWAVHNCDKLGSTGEVICLAGDSAGGNLILATAMRAASFDIRRPDGILGVYTPVLVRYTPSPARLLCLMDPLLPAGILSRCLAAYAGVSDELSSQLAASVNCHIESSAATLRLSSQENGETDWVVVSQDAAASTKKTLPPPQQKPTQEAQRAESAAESWDEENGNDEVEIFSRPRMAAAAVVSTVTDAGNKLVSYVGSYTQMLTKNFGAGGQVPEDVEIHAVGSSPSGSHVDEDVSSGEETSATYKSMLERGNTMDDINASSDHSPLTPSFHTPLTSPSVSKEELTSMPSPAVNTACDLEPVTMTTTSVSRETPTVAGSQPEDGEPKGGGQTAAGSDDVTDAAAVTLGTGDSKDVTVLTPVAADMAESDCSAGNREIISNTLVDVDFQNQNQANSAHVSSGDESEIREEPGHMAVPSHSAGDLMDISPTENSPSLKAGANKDSEGPGRQTEPVKTQESASPNSLVSQAESLAGEKKSGSADMIDSESSQPQSFMPSLTEDKAELLQQELDNSVISGTDSVTLPSSLVSTPSDDLNVYEVLGEGRQQEVVAVSPGDESGNCPVKGEDAQEFDQQTSPAAKGSGIPGDTSSPSGKQTAVAMNKGEGEETAFSDVVLSEFETSPDPLRSVNAGAERSVPHSHIMSDPSSKDSSMQNHITQLPEDTFLLSDLAFNNGEAGKPASSTSACVGQLPGPSRSGLRLDLHHSASTSSMPRSCSMPAFTDAAVSRSSHCMSPSDFKRERHLAQSPMHAIRNIPIVKNPYMSPLLAPDFLLEGLPHVCLVACHLDPLLDDSIMFTRRLRSIGKSVDLVLVDDLPHGFLNFSLASRDAKHASDLCVAKLRKFLYPGDSLSA